MKKAIFFFDANNWYHNVKKYYNPSEIDIQKLVNFFCKIKDYDLVEIRWYASVPSISDGENIYYRHISYLDNLEKKGIKVILTKSKAEKIPFEDNFFDKTIFIATLHCIKGKQNRKKVLKEIYRALKPNGKVLITAWNKNSKRWKNKPKETKVSWNIKENEKIFRYYYLYSYEELKKELEKTGFKVTEINKINDARNIVMIGEKPKFKSS